MTKADIAKEIAKQNGIGKATVLTIVDRLMEVIKESLANGENVYMRGFGSFIVKTRAARTARNISLNTTIDVPGRKIPYFKPAECLKEDVAK